MRTLTIIAAAMIVIVLIATTMLGGRSADAVTQKLGGTTTKSAAVSALDGTGYAIHFRKVPRLEQFELVAGEARDGAERVQFGVEIGRAGPSSSGGADPQPPLVRYAQRENGERVGNIDYWIESQSTAVAGRGIELENSKTETKMSNRIAVALDRLFAPRFVPGP
jgi:hypothetical protein